MRKSVLFLFSFLILSPLSALADEGMWILSLLSQYNIKQMQELGCRLSPEQIYSINNASLKDAVVIFGGGCTGEIVSNEGLVFTNHHCGYDAIQQLSSVEHNYLKDGFWATSKDMDLPVKGLKVRFMDSFEDVTDEIVSDIPDDLSPLAYEAVIAERVATLEQESSSSNEFEEVSIESFFGGNQFFRIKYKVYSDIRLVGTPPESIGKFGHDTDNWHWPRHTGDFSIFRVYAGADNEPAKYSANNVPLKPKYFLPISLKGNKPGDFAMTIGYPGSTERYLSSWGVEQTMNAENASRIEPRKIKEDIWIKAMRENQDTYIKYSVKYAHSSNYHYNSIGMNKGIKDLDVIKRKQNEQKAFQKWAKKHAPQYASVVKNLKKDYKEFAPYAKARAYWSECLYSGVELFGFANRLFNVLLSEPDEDITEDMLIASRDLAKDFYKNYVPELDRKVAVALFSYYYENIDKKFHPDIFSDVKSVKGIPAVVDSIFSKSLYVSEDQFMNALSGEKIDLLRQDVLFDALRSVIRVYFSCEDKTSKLSASLEQGNRLYIKGRMEMNPDKAFYSDANFTCRLSYGKVGGYTANGKNFSYFTDLEGVMAKEDPNNWEFVVSDRLKTLFNNKDFGQYADADGRMHVCFITDNDITGGNSGSPVINGDGQLIGLAFDGNWEAMSGDIIFEPNLQRCICVDIRYVLFVIDKFGGAKNLIDELLISK